MTKHYPCILFVCLVLSACTPRETVSSGQENTQPEPPAAITLGSGLDLANMDASVAPGDDFYHYVNGAWLLNTEIPADKSNYGAFTVLADVAEENLLTIIEEAAATDAAIGSDSQ